MARASRTLLAMITNEATRTFPMDLMAGCDGDPNQQPHQDFADNWKIWCNHWVKTGERIHQQFVDEGLTETAAAVRKHIDWQKRYIT